MIISSILIGFVGHLKQKPLRMEGLLLFLFSRKNYYKKEKFPPCEGLIIVIILIIVETFIFCIIYFIIYIKQFLSSFFINKWE